MSEALRIGPYLVGEHLAGGGMGEVYRGLHERLHRPVALKRIRTDRLAKTNARRRFLREARATARLNHPAIVQVHDIIEEDGADWLVMELVEGATLKQLMEDGPVDWPRVVHLAVQVAEGLTSAHEAGIIHRDLKSENVILSNRGQAKILDFGLAKSTQDEEAFDPGISHEDAVIGTPRIMSPEQAQGKDLDARTDLFSFGVLLYEALTGISPFVGASTLETLTRICHRPHEPPRRYVASIPVDLERLIDHLLQKEAADRPAGAAQVAEALRRIARSGPHLEIGAAHFVPDDVTLIDAQPQPGREGEPQSTTMPARPVLRPEDTPTMPQGKLPDLTPSTASHVRVPKSDGSKSGAPVLLRERRQVTLLWCDLETGDLGEEEALRASELLREALHESCLRFDGRPTEVPGPHRMACFGFPSAHEDDPRRAVHAALRVLERLEAVVVERLRLGIHTGPAVVVPELAQSEPLAFGATLDQVTAAGRQARPGEILLSAVTKRLADRAVEVEARGPVVLPGMDSAQPLFRLTGLAPEHASLPDRSESGTLVGREPEIDLLESHWQRAAAGRFQVVEICGEAGIGKSHLAWSLRQRLQDPAPRWIAAAGSPFARRVPLQPILQCIRGLLRLDPDISDEEQLQRLSETLMRLDLASTQALPLLAAQLSLPLDASVDPGPSGTNPQKRLRLTLEAIVALLLSVCEREPTILLIEDLHKADPSTLDLLQLLIQQEADVPLLLVLTMRPELITSWSHRADLMQLRLQPLNARHCEEIIDRLAEQRSFPESLRREVLQRADGVPLFLEEITKALLEAEDLEQSASTLPLTLRDSLASRLDRLDSARAIAQTAAVIGRELPMEWLRRLVDQPVDELRDELDRLVDAGILLRRGFGSRARFVFKHALIRDAAYESLLPRARRKAHARVVEVLEEHFPQTVDREPETIAHHAEASGDAARAIRALQRAGRRAVDRSALLEAAQSYRHALTLLEPLPASLEKDRRELDLRLALGSTAMSIDGYGAPEVGECYARAEELCHSLDDHERLFSVLWGLYAFRVVRAELDRALALDSRLLQIAEDNDEPLQCLEAHQAAGLIRFYRGNDLPKTLHHLETVAALESPTRDRSLSFSLRHHDVGITHLSFWALSAWMNGEPEQAISRSEKAIELARRLGRPYSLTFALNYGAWLGFLLRDVDRTLEHADEEFRIAEEKGFFWMHIATIFRGWAIGERGEIRRGLQLVRRGRTGYLATGARLGQTLHLAIEAELCLRDEEYEDAGDALDEAMMMAEGTGEQFWEPELWRLRGEWLHATGDASRAEQAFAQAIDTARRHGCVALLERAEKTRNRFA